MKLFILILTVSGSIALCSPTSLSNYPISDEIWIDAADGTISPIHIEHFVSTADTTISILTDSGANLKKGEQWATIAPKDLTLKERALKLTQKKTTLALDLVEDKVREETLISKEKIRSLKGSIRQLERITTSKDTSNSLKLRTLEAIELTNRQVEKLRKLTSEEQINLKEEIEREDLTLVVLKAEDSYDLQYKKSVLLAPFDGTIKLADLSPVSKDGDTSMYKLKAGALFATISDESTYILTINKPLPIFNVSDKSHISVRFEAGAQSGMIDAVYHKAVNRGLNGNIMQSYQFTINKTHRETSQRLLGQTKTVYVYYHLGRDCSIVPKNDLALIAPSILKASGWKGLVQHLYPHSRLILVGSDSLAIAPSKDGH